MTSNKENIFQINSELLTQVAALNSEQLIWMNGYVYGLQVFKKVNSDERTNGVQITNEINPDAIVQPMSDNKSQSKITILYGSQSGNSKKLATGLCSELAERKLNATLCDMNEYKAKNLKSEKLIFIVVSTYGEGEPPDSAKELYDYIYSERVGSLENIQFSVLALGDKSYAKYCQTGIDFDIQFEKLRAKRIVARVDCDVNYDEAYTKWKVDVLRWMDENLVQKKSNVQEHVKVNTQIQQSETGIVYSRTNPYYASVLNKIQLNGAGSIKETWHIELSNEHKSLEFLPGDALGIFPQNDEKFVQTIIDYFRWDEKREVLFQGKKYLLKELLTSHVELGILSSDFIQHYAEHHQILKQLLEAGHIDISQTSKQNNIFSFIKPYPVRISPDTFVSYLRPLQARLYSIASSPLEYEDEIHLTIGAVRGGVNGTVNSGICSTWLADKINVKDKVPIFIHRNDYFKVPQDGNVSMIMIGAGTGIAPYRAFMQEREQQGAKGKHWLIFGNPNFTTDFLYQLEWQSWIKKGLLQNISLAFSRDQKEKIYVSHKIKEKGKELIQWIENGAVLYVCGDKNKMAKDVYETLVGAVSEHVTQNNDDAIEYVKNLKKQRRYLEDVY